MFYKKRIEKLEARVAELNEKISTLTETVRVQNNEINLLWSQLKPQNTETKPTHKPKRYRRKIDGKETKTTNE